MDKSVPALTATATYTMSNYRIPADEGGHKRERLRYG